jgi:hypothetical protein
MWKEEVVTQVEALPWNFSARPSENHKKSKLG